jgi:hypothetical protein
MRLTPTERNAPGLHFQYRLSGINWRTCRTKKKRPATCPDARPIKKDHHEVPQNSKHSTAKQRETNLAYFFRRTVLALPEFSGLQPPS